MLTQSIGVGKETVVVGRISITEVSLGYLEQQAFNKTLVKNNS